MNPIRLILPTYKDHFALSNLLAQRFAKLGDMKDRKATVVVTWENHFDLEKYLAFLGQHFKEVDFKVLPDTPEGLGWPEAGNHLFYGAAEYLHSIKNEDPWMFFEPDMFVLQKYWLDRFDEEYARVGKPYLGTINDTRFLDKIAGKVHKEGQHMVGAGVYPPDFFTKSKKIHMLEHVPWDLEIQDEVVPECFNTSLIFHAWSTRAYHFTEEGVLIGKDVKRVVHEGTHFYARPVNPGCAVIHGCKDDSLYRVWANPANAEVIKRFGPQT
jgi:hypothetical protein